MHNSPGIVVPRHYAAPLAVVRVHEAVRLAGVSLLRTVASPHRGVVDLVCRHYKVTTLRPAAVTLWRCHHKQSLSDRSW